MEQLAARRAHNPKVTGSSPVPAIQKMLWYLKLIPSFFNYINTIIARLHI